MNEIGYHGTCSKYRYNIEKNGLDPSKCKHRDDHWLGQGVYFFDDYDKAMWWATSISSQNNNCGGVTFITKTIETLKEVEKFCDRKMPIFEDAKLRAVFFDYYKEKNKISVIIGTFLKEFAGYTARRSHSEIELQKKIMYVTGIKFQERQICVSKKECIKSTKLIYNEEEEVI